MSGNFITNQNNNFLSEVINGILPKCDRTDFLVGYFYFSGFVELYEQIKTKHLRVLVGLEIERDIINRVKEVDYHSTLRMSRSEIKKSYFDSLVDLYNETDYFDSEVKAEAFKTFYEKIKDGTLEIRKTKDPNHAKMYLFENRDDLSEGGTYPGSLITGSSNLSMSGLKGRWELNAILRSKSDYLEGRDIFEQLWEEAIILADKDHIEEFQIQVLDKTRFEKLYSPYIMYLRVLQEYFKVNYDKDFRSAYDITNGKFLDLKYQADAIKKSLSVIENHNGVIISDVVGLGKSIIASAVAHNIATKTIIIAPPHLCEQWEDYRHEFAFNAMVFSSGSIEKALKYYNDHNTDNKKWLIIVDEAHKYRNEYTKDYFCLHQLCQGNKVMLLTATPYNNHPQDIYSMVKLFQIPSKSTLKTVENLGREFRYLINSYKQLVKDQKKRSLSEKAIKVEVNNISSKIRAIISPLIIRRSRLDLEGISEYKKDLKQQNIEFAKIVDPELLEYNLGNLKDLYIKTFNLISPTQDYKSRLKKEGKEICEFIAARYKPITYEREEGILKKQIEDAGFEYNLFRGTQKNLAKFMRHLLVRRFESSTEAFKNTIDFMISSSERVLNWIELRRKIPIYRKGYLPDIDLLYQSDNDNTDDDIINEGVELELSKLKSKGLFEIDMSFIKENEFLHDIHSDIDLLKSIRDEWFKNSFREDPKVSAFIHLLKEMRVNDPKRKIVVFSEFSDTINYLFESFKDTDLGVFKYTSKDASKVNREIIKNNFDAGVDIENQMDDYHILLATDAISEGYSLHRAGAIFNFDIPYNPTKVIQRIGRINRINKKVFDKLYIYNYFPTDIGEKETRTKEISTLKMSMIHSIMGEDTKVLTSHEELKSFYKEEYDKENRINEAESWETKYTQLLDDTKDTRFYEEAQNIAHRAKIQRTTDKSSSGVLVFGKKSTDYIFKLGINKNEIFSLTPEDAISLFEANILEKSTKISDQFDSIYQSVKNKLFEIKKDDTVDKTKRDALKKINVIEKQNLIENDYLSSIKEVINMDGLSGYCIRLINKLKVKEYTQLPFMIPETYLNRMIRIARDVDFGSEVLILSEELKK